MFSVTARTGVTARRACSYTNIHSMLRHHGAPVSRLAEPSLGPDVLDPTCQRQAHTAGEEGTRISTNTRILIY